MPGEVPSDIPPYDFTAAPLGPSPDVDDNGVVPSVAIASKNTGINVVAPAALGPPAVVYATNAATPVERQTVVLRYQATRYGDFDVFERAEGMGQEGHAPILGGDSEER